MLVHIVKRKVDTADRVRYFRLHESSSIYCKQKELVAGRDGGLPERRFPFAGPSRRL